MEEIEMDSVPISIIIPVYNTQKYLEDCLDSVIMQSFRDIEIICINDGSTDDSPRIIQEYASRDSRIMVVHQDNHGLAYTRNIGVQLAQGKYIYFMDSDDILADGALESLFDVAEANDAEVIFFEGSSFFEAPELEKKYASYKDAYERFYDINGVVDGQTLLEWYETYNKFVVSACLVFLRKDFLTVNHISFYNGILYEDNVYHIKLLLALRNGYVLHEKLFQRRVRNDSIMTATKYRFKQLYSWFICYYELLSLLPLFEKMGRKDCLALLLDSFTYNMRRVSKGLQGVHLDQDDLSLYKKMDPLQRQILNNLGMGITPKMASVSKYCGESKNIAIYGAGGIGISIYKCLNQGNGHNKIHIVDRAVTAIDDIPEVIVSKPCDLPNISFDLLIICVGNEALAKGIAKQLNHEYGIAGDKMMWYGDLTDYVVG